MDLTKSIYEQIGGAEGIDQLVNSFYDHVEKDPILRPLFPADFDEVREKQKWFLTQFFGGPPLYTEKKGHPMLRARHLPFTIGQEQAEAWLRCMSKALDDQGISGKLREHMWSRLSMTAYHMINNG